MTPNLMQPSRGAAAWTGPTTLWTVLLVVVSGCLLTEATPHLTYHRPAQRGKNWCAFIVNKNVSCTVMDGTESFIQPQYRCSWNQIHCQPTLAYKVGFRPRYVTSYKVVTELEWRCCPGYKGEDCKEGPADKVKQTPLQTPRPSGGKKNLDPHGQQQKPLESKREESNEAQEKKIQTLEEEMIRLTQTIIDMQTSLSTVNENLKITVQEDASKFLNTWLNNLTPTASATGGKTEYYLPGFTGSAEKEDGLKDLVSELTNAREELQKKSDQIEELTRKINLYEERLIDIEEMSRQPTATAPVSNIDDKLEALRNEMLEGMDRKMADLKNSCEYKLINVQQQCEENENGCTEVKEFVLEKETELRNEIDKLRSQIPTSPNGDSSCCNSNIDTILKNLGQKVDRIAEANVVLNARLDSEVQRLSTLTPDQAWNEKLIDLEFKVNVSERNVEEHCFYIEDTLRGLINSSVDSMSNLIDWKLQLLENRLGDANSNHDPADSSNTIPSSVFNEVNELKDVVQKLDNEFRNALHGKGGSLSDNNGNSNNYEVLVQTQLDNTFLLKSLTDTMNEKFELLQNKTSALEESLTDTVNEKFELLQNKTSDLEELKLELGTVKFDIYRIEDSIDLLNDKFGSLKDQVRDINSTVRNTQLGLSAKVEVVQKLFDTTSDASTNGNCCNNLQDSFEILKRELTADKAKCPENSQGIRTELSNVDARVSKLENVCGKLDTISGSLQRIKDGLNKHVTSLWSCIGKINGTIKSHSNDIYGLKNSVQVFQTQITKITTDLQDLTKSKPGEGSVPKHTVQIKVIPQIPPKTTGIPKYPQVPQEPVYPQVPIIPSIPKQPAQPEDPQYPGKPKSPSHEGQPQLPLEPTNTKPKQPPSEPEPPTPTGSIVIPLVPGRNGVIIEHGQAGPPGRMVQTGSAKPQGADGEQDMEMSKGFAGAPGYPKPAKDTKDQISTTTFSESRGESATTVQISFSAGLTERTNSFEVGFIPFNNVLVNDGDYYNPETGIFTVPIEGRYMLSAVLTPEHGHYVEAVLLVNNASVAQLDSSGYRRELLEYHRPSSSKPVCSGIGTFNLIMNLKAADEVAIVLTGGKLANSDSDEMYSTFSGVLLYPSTPLR
ncbi:EMILIN-2 [Engystomops pustulosus]|uniref:EMILIN-2 n=1 Tax=Engystomops pustulosus TaxID=76066 RepID=UPI003AFABC0A